MTRRAVGCLRGDGPGLGTARGAIRRPNARWPGLLWPECWPVDVGDLWWDRGISLPFLDDQRCRMDEKYLDADRKAVELLRAARQGRSLTQADIADAMAELGFHWTQPTVARVENGQRPLSLAEARALMDILALNKGNAYQRIESLDFHPGEPGGSSGKPPPPTHEV
jgi:hypothetical protein